MDFKSHFERAWKLTIANIVPLVLMTLVMYGVSIITLGILMPVAMAGFMYSVLLLVRRGREPKIKDVFTHMKLFLPLFLFGLVSAILITIGFLLLVLPGVLIALGITFLTLYMIPLMVDKDRKLMEAIKESAQIVTRGQVVEHIVVLIIFTGLIIVGQSLAGIGVLFTQPLATVFLMDVYDKNIASGSQEPV